MVFLNGAKRASSWNRNSPFFLNDLGNFDVLCSEILIGTNKFVYANKNLVLNHEKNRFRTWYQSFCVMIFLISVGYRPPIKVMIHYWQLHFLWFIKVSSSAERFIRVRATHCKCTFWSYGLNNRYLTKENKVVGYIIEDE